MTFIFSISKENAQPLLRSLKTFISGNGLQLLSVYILLQLLNLLVPLSHSLDNVLSEYHSAVIATKYSAGLSLEVGGVNSSARTVNWSLIFRGEGDIGQNSPCVQFEADIGL